MRAALAAILLAFGSSAFAQEWEYLIVYLPGKLSDAEVEQLPEGGYVDLANTRTLNALAAEGWELVTVTGRSGADNAAYLRRGR